MDLEEAGREWKSALLQSKMAAVEARLARQSVNMAFMESVAGNGPPPTSQQLEELARIEQSAEDRRLIEEAILNKVFGVDTGLMLLALPFGKTDPESEVHRGVSYRKSRFRRAALQQALTRALTIRASRHTLDA